MTNDVNALPKKLVVRSNYGPATTDYSFPGAYPMYLGGAQKALDHLLETDKATVQLYYGGRYVATITRDGTVRRPV